MGQMCYVLVKVLNFIFRGRLCGVAYRYIVHFNLTCIHFWPYVTNIVKRWGGGRGLTTLC